MFPEYIQPTSPPTSEHLAPDTLPLAHDLEILPLLNPTNPPTYSSAVPPRLSSPVAAAAEPEFEIVPALLPTSPPIALRLAL
jgi:hypothetical protein